ncbi:MAG: hypothetical protein RLY86_646 [Pseudomonadota bacterium]|jgi:ATP-binding cassette subfamily C protein
MTEVTRLLHRFWHLVRTTLGIRRVALVAALTVAGTLAEGAGILMLVPLLAYLGLGGENPALPDPAILAGALGLYLVIVAGAAGLAALRSVQATALQLRLMDALRGRLHRAVLNLSWPAFQSLRAADLQHALTTEIQRIGLLVDAMVSLGVAMLLVPVMLTVALVLSPALTLMTLAVAGIAVLATRTLGRRVFELGRRQGDVYRGMLADLGDDLAGFKVIKSFRVEDARAAAMGRHFRALRDAQMAYARNRAVERALLQMAAAVTVALALLAAIGPLGLSLAAAGGLILAFGRLAQALLRALTMWRMALSALPALESVEAALARCAAGADVGEEPATPSVEPTVDLPAAIPPLAVAIAFTGVSVTYPDGRRGLAGVEARLPARATTALIGPSGAGKSTLADLAAGLSGPGAGLVTLDGRPLTAAGRRAWRARVGLVPQDPFLFHDTIRANLLVARPDADDAALTRALEDAAALDFVTRLPHGLGTVVGERGSALSGGERQRIALARALLRRPELLILDEATSALDQETEAAIARSLERLRGRLTVLVIAHRPSTVRGADHVILMEGGRVTAAGPWADIRGAAGDRLAELGMG